MLLLEAPPEALDKLLNDWGLEVGASNDEKKPALTLTEAVVSSQSPASGRTIASLRLRRRYDVNVVAVSRASEPYRGRLRSFRFRTGDVLLLEGDAENLPDAIADRWESSACPSRWVALPWR